MLNVIQGGGRSIGVCLVCDEYTSLCSRSVFVMIIPVCIPVCVRGLYQFVFLSEEFTSLRGVTSLCSCSNKMTLVNMH